MPGIFVSYRRDDSAGHAGRLVADLKRRFGADAVFQDIASIEPGADWERALEKGVGSCAVLLAVIGRDWTDARNERGERRIDDPADPLRREIATALRLGTRVIPVLVNGAKPPSESAMPDDLDPLAKRQAQEITDSRWDYDVEQLVKVLARVPGLKLLPQGETVPPPRKGRLGKVIGWTVAVLVVLGVIGNLIPQDTPPEPSLLPPAAPTAPVHERAAADAAPAAPPPAAAPGEPAITTQADVAPARADLSGRWRDQDGFIYVVQQQGSALSFQVLDPDDGTVAGIGIGSVLGGAAVSAITDYGGHSRWQSELTLSPDGRSLQGVSVDLATRVREPVHLHR